MKMKPCFFWFSADETTFNGVSVAQVSRTAYLNAVERSPFSANGRSPFSGADDVDPYVDLLNDSFWPVFRFACDAEKWQTLCDAMDAAANDADADAALMAWLTDTWSKAAWTQKLD